MSETVTLYHNPACSKSRLCLELLQQHMKAQDLTLIVRDYLSHKLTKHELALLAQKLTTAPQYLVRPSDELALDFTRVSSSEIIDLLSLYPHLLQRPIVEFRDKAVIARPPELALTLLAA